MSLDRAQRGQDPVDLVDSPRPSLRLIPRLYDELRALFDRAVCAEPLRPSELGCRSEVLSMDRLPCCHPTDRRVGHALARARSPLDVIPLVRRLGRDRGTTASRRWPGPIAPGWVAHVCLRASFLCLLSPRATSGNVLPDLDGLALRWLWRVCWNPLAEFEPRRILRSRPWVLGVTGVGSPAQSRPDADAARP